MSETMAQHERAIPAGYRMTELGPLPEEWRVVRLGEVFHIQQGKALSRKKDKGIRPRPFLRTANVFWGRIDVTSLDHMDFSAEEEAKYALRPGDLLVCEGGDIGRTTIWEGSSRCIYYQNHLHRLRCIHPGTSEPLFYMYWMQAAINILRLYGGQGNKTTIPNLSRSRLAGFCVPSPPLPEQRAIAHVLRTVQRAKEATERVIHALRELKKSLMRHLFTYGPVPVDGAEQVPLKETEAGPVPEHWRVVRLREVGEVITGRTPSTARQEYWDNGSVPFITPSDLDGRPIRWASRAISKEGLKEARPLPRGTVLVSCIGHIGKMGVTETALAVTNQQINAIIPRDVETWFLAYLLMYEVSLLANRARMTTVPILSKTNFEKVPVFIAPLPEQRDIANMLQTVDRKIEAEEQRRAALEALFKTLLHDLMTARRRLPPAFVAQFEQAPEDTP